MKQLVIALISAFAVLAGHAEEGQSREAAGTGNSKAEACSQAKAFLKSYAGDDYYYVPEEDCSRCEEQHSGSYPFKPTGQWFCAIKGVEQKRAPKRLKLPSR